ncbi:MAG: hypothetical protein Q8Q42_03125 [Nanoarchaeota archaeon]|nr:hypothetical protein [Nanoarchaeota archaeon]
MEKRGLVLSVVLILAVAMFASNFNNNPTGQQVTSVNKIATTPNCNLQLYDSARIEFSPSPSQTYPIAADMTLDKTMMPSALKDTQVESSILTQRIETHGQIVFEEGSTRDGDIKNFYFHVDDRSGATNNELFADTYLTFTPEVELRRGQELNILGTPYYVRDVMITGSDITIKLESCRKNSNPYSYPSSVEIRDYQTYGIVLIINQQTMTQVTGNINFNHSTGKVREIHLETYLDSLIFDTYLPPGDASLQSKIEDPESLLGLDAEMDARLITSSAGPQVEQTLIYDIPVYG